MADKFINQLPAAGALTGAELVPVMQSGNTVQTTTGGILFQPSGFLDVSIGLITTVQATTVSTSGASGGYILLSQSDGSSSTTITCTGVGAGVQMNLNGIVQTSSKFAANGATPQAKASVNAACTDLPTVIALTNQLRAALIANGICQ